LTVGGAAPPDRIEAPQPVVFTDLLLKTTVSPTQ